MTSRIPRTPRSIRRRLGLLTIVGLIGTMAPLAAASGAGAEATAPEPARTAVPDVFSKLDGFTLDRTAKTSVQPTHYTAYSVSVPQARTDLASTPTARQVARGAEPTSFTLPDPTGAPQTFLVQEDSVLQPALQAAHPEIRTYAGTGVTDPGTSIRFDVTPLGLHASVRDLAGGASWYVDPAYVQRGETDHLSYYGAAVPASGVPFVERELAGEVRQSAAEAAGEQSAQARPAAGAQVIQRTYRMALISDPTYATYFGTTNVLAAKASLLNRANQAYNDDLAIKFVLIDATPKLNLDTAAKATGANGPCGASACYTAAQLSTCGSGTLTRNNFVLGQLAGADAFDIGHIALGVAGGGIAGLGVVGGSRKASGCTGVPTPTGDLYAIDYFAHEVGHEMGGHHTFNGTQVNCSLTNRTGSTSVEPGSGSSIMAYAGICASDDLQPHSDPYFSQRSIDEIDDTVTADPSTEDEVQSINLFGFDGMDSKKSFTLTYTDLAGVAHAPVSIVGGLTTYNNIQIAQKVQQLTGCRNSISGYDGDDTANDDGFVVTFDIGCSGTDLARIGVAGFSDGVSGFVGVLTNGGADTNPGTAVVTSNHAPTVTVPADLTIPTRTPFTLTGKGTDVDTGQKLTYLWEQNDTGTPVNGGGTALVAQPKLNGPLFRVFGTYADVSGAGTLQSPSPGINLATTDPSRTFPDLSQILAGNTNAKTGRCPVATANDTRPSNVPRTTVDCDSEYLPTSDYGSAVAGTPSTGAELNFRLTARDQFPTGGGTQFDDVTLTVDSSAGPLLVTSRGTAGTPAQAGAKETVLWDVNGTDAADLAPNVKISLSTDGGQTFPTVLAATTPNDGIEQVTLPNVATGKARIKVEAVGNIFFDINDADFAIQGPVSVTKAADQTVQYSDDFSSPVTVTATSSKVDGDNLTATVSGLSGLSVTRESATADGVSPSNAVFRIRGPVTAAPGTYPVTVTVNEPGGGVATSSFTVTVTQEDATAKYTGPTSVTTDDASTSVPLSATIGDAADTATGDVTRATVTFVDRSTGGTLCTSAVTGGPTSGTASCSATFASASPGKAYTIGTVVGGSYVRNSSSDNATLTVTRNVDATAPNTTITGGPASSSFVLTNRVTYTQTSSESGSSFACTFDGVAVAGCGASARVTPIKPGTHKYRVTAKDAAGNADPTPASRVFNAPFNGTQLSKQTGGWTSKKDQGSYRGTFTQATTSGRVLSRQGDQIRRVALVATRCQGCGRVRIFFGDDLIRTVNLGKGAVGKQQLIVIKSYSAPVSGLFRIVTVDDKPVRIEGLGLLQALS